MPTPTPTHTQVCCVFAQLTVGGQCSLQPGRIFGQLRCLQPTDAGGSSGEGSSSKVAAVEDKLLYMYCSNNCGFQFHASCWKVGMAEAWCRYDAWMSSAACLSTTSDRTMC